MGVAAWLRHLRADLGEAQHPLRPDCR